MPDKSLPSKQLRTIVVDLTPVLPGGENGGAKVFVLELLRRLSEAAPQTEFILLTQAASHEELAILDRPNMRRMMVLDTSHPPAMRSLAARLYGAVLRRLPERSQRVVGRFKHSVRTSWTSTGLGSSLLRVLKSDLLFCPFTAPTYFDPRVPTVATIYDLQYKTYPQFFSAEDVIQRGRTFIEAARRSAGLVAISDYSRDVAIKEGNLDPDIIKTIHLHISQHSLRNAARDETILERLQLTAGEYLIYPANFWKHKNHEMLLTAFGIACGRGLEANVRLVCTGAPGARQEWLKQAAVSMGLGARVVFPGYIATAELLALVTRSAGVVFPSLYEGFGLPVIEAMATGVPVACSNVTSLPGVAGDAAILFDPRVPEDIARAMISLAHDKELTAQLIAAGDLRAALFSDSTLMAAQYWEVFQQAARLHKSADLLIGAHGDGWASPDLQLQFSPATPARTLKMTVNLPGWAPISEVRIRFRQDDDTTDEFTVLRGSSESLSVPLPTTGGYFDIELSPAFVPALTGIGSDERKLTVNMLNCEIISADGNSISLLPQSRSA